MYRRSGLGALPGSCYTQTAGASISNVLPNLGIPVLTNQCLSDIAIYGGYTTPPPPPPVQPPNMATDPTGAGVDTDAQAAAAQAAYLVQLQQWADAQSVATPVDQSSVGAIANCLAGAQSVTDYANCLMAGPGMQGLPAWVLPVGVLVVILVVWGLVER